MRTFRVSRSVYSIVYAPDNSALWVGDGTGRVHRWDLAAGTGQPVFQVPAGVHTSAVYNLSISADGRVVAASSYGSVAMMVSELPTEVVLSVAEPLPHSIHSALAPNGNLLAVADQTGKVVVWDRRQQQVRRLGLQHEFACVISFSPDSLRLAVGYLRGILVIYDSHTGEQDGPFIETTQPEVITFSPDGRLLAAATGNEVVLWDATTRQRSRTIRTGRAFIRRLAFHPAGQFLATAGDVPTITFWDTQGRSRGSFNWEIGQVQALAFTPNGMTAAAGGSSGKVAVWDVEDKAI